MKFVGNPYSIDLSNTPVIVPIENGLARGVRVQPNVDMCYRLDGELSPTLGFILPQYQVEDLETTGNTLVVWATDAGRGRLIVQAFL